MLNCGTTIRLWAVCICTASLAACGGGGGGPGQPVAGGSASGTIQITVTQPADAGYMETTDDTVVLQGTAHGTSRIASVAWRNDRGGEGQASGGATWKTSGIPLQPGNNSITISASDVTGGSGSRTIVIHRESQGTGSVTLSWTAPTAREDGTPLTNLAGYTIRYGRMSAVYDFQIEVDNAGVTTYVVDGLKPGTWYFVLSAYDANGLESHHSNEVKRKVE